MLSARSVARTASRVPRAVRGPKIQQCRPQSTGNTGNLGSAARVTPSSGQGTSHIASGLAGGIVAASLLYGVYTMTPSGRMASKLNKAAREADKKYQQAASTLKDKAPSTDEAISRVKQFCYAYVAWVPGGRQYVDTAFKDFESIRERHGEDVDRIVAETYQQFQDVAKSGLSMESASKAYDALAELGQKLAKLAGSAADQILENHPQLKEKVGGPINQLKQMGEQYGPEAKKMVDETWDQVGDILAGGFSADSVDKVRRLVEDKSQKLRQFGDQAWQKGLEQAKPYLDKNPQVKELVMKNQDKLRQGNATALFKQVKTAAEGGDFQKFEEYIKNAVDKTKSSAGQKASSVMGGSTFAGLGQFLGLSSKDGGDLRKHLELLSEVVNNHASEGKKLLEETRDELKQVLEEKAKKAQKIVDSAQKAE